MDSFPHLMFGAGEGGSNLMSQWCFLEKLVWRRPLKHWERSTGFSTGDECFYAKDKLIEKLVHLQVNKE